MAVTAKIPSDFFADPLQLSQRHTITCQSHRPVTQGCSIRTAKVGKDDPDLITHDGPRLPNEDQSQSRFPSWKGKRLSDALAGLLRAFWLEDMGREILRPVTRVEFLADFRKTCPQVAFTVVLPEKISVIQPEASATSLAQRRSKLLIDFLRQLRCYNFQPLIDQLHADVDVAGCLAIIKPASPSRRFVGPLKIGPSF